MHMDAQVSQLKRLQKLAVPFALGPQQLRELSRLPDLFELLCWCSLELDALGLAHDPLPAVTRLVASSINGHGQPLAAWFPGLQEVCLRSCGDMESLSLRSCLGLSVLLAGDCSGLSDVGFAALRTLRGLQRLQLEGASQVRSVTERYLHWWLAPGWRRFCGCFGGRIGGCSPGSEDKAGRHKSACLEAEFA